MLGVNDTDLVPGQWGYRSIRTLLFVVSLGMALVVVGLNGFYAWQGYNAAIDAEKRDARNLVRSIESQTDRIFRETEEFMEGIGDLYLMLSRSGFLDDQLFHEYLKKKAEEQPHINVIFILDENTHALVSARVPVIPGNMRNRRVGFVPDVIPQNKDFFLGGLERATPRPTNDFNEQWVFPVFLKIRDEAGDLRGYVAAVLDPVLFNEFVATLEVGDYGDILIWDGTGALVAAHPNSSLEIGTVSDDIARRMEGYRSGGYEIVIYTILTDIGDSSIVMSTKGVEGAQLGIAAYLSSKDYLAPWYRSVVTLGAITFTVVLIILGLTYALYKQLKQKEAGEAALNVAREEAEYASKAKSQFLAQISHELRTPLNAIIGFSEIIKERIYGDAIGDKYVESAENIHSSGDHLLRIVNDLIDLSRAESGKFAVKLETVRIGDCVDAAQRLLSKEAFDKSVILACDGGQPDLRLNIDRRLMEHVLINLLSNAIKFSEPGSRVGVSVDVNKDGNVAINVRDSGPGMDDSLIRRIGEPFIVERAQINVPGRGAGLGLSISKRFVEMMGGRLTIESNIGSGTIATVVFPSTVMAGMIPRNNALSLKQQA